MKWLRATALRAAVVTAASIAIAIPPTAFAQAGTCQLAGSVCVDGPSTKIINGDPVTLPCWQYTNTYNCVDPNSLNTCGPLTTTTGCGQTSSTCATTAFNGTCTMYNNDWACISTSTTAATAPPLSPIPTGITLLPPSPIFTVLSDIVDATACSSYVAAAPNCVLDSTVCSDSTPATRNVNGDSITETCWAYTDTYTCAGTLSGGTTSDCGPLLGNAACTQTSSSCTSYLPSGACAQTTRVFTCTGAPTTVAINSCNNCPAGNPNCNAPTNNANDFNTAVSTMEMMRQLGTYMDPATLQIFRGVASDCTIKLGGIVNCCNARSSTTAVSNGSSPAMKAGIQFGTALVMYAGSNYVFDPLYDYVESSLTSLYAGLAGNTTGQAAAGASSTPFSFYGLSYLPGEGFAFDPTSLAISVAIAIIVSYLSCSASDQLTGMRKGQNLCTYIGSWASNCFLGVCLDTQQGYCCYNSLIARILNEQGRAQLNIPFGNPQTPNCSGLTIADIALINWSLIDLSQFTASIQSTAIDTVNVLTRAAGDLATRAASTTATTGALPVSPPPR